MTWTDPRTWSVSEVLTAAHLNEQLRDNLRALAAQDVADTAVSFPNTSTEGTLYTVTVPGGLLGVNDALRLRLFGDGQVGSTGDCDFRHRLKFGGVTMHDSTQTYSGSNSTRIAWWIDVLISNQGAADSQYLAGVVGSQRNAPTTGVGTLGGGGAAPVVSNGLLSIDTSTDQTLAYTCQMSNANANNWWRLYGARLTVEPA